MEIINNRLDWQIVKLGKFATHEKGKKPKRENKEFNEVFRHPYINIEAFEKGVVCSYTDGEKCNFCSEEDFLMVWDGSRSGLVGKGVNGALGSTLVKISFPIGIENAFAFYFLKSKYQQINTRAKGTGTPHVDPSLLWNYDFPIAPLPEQRAIVSKIEELFSSLDSGVADLEKALEQLKVYRQAVLKKAFEGELTSIKLEAVSEAIGGYAFESKTFLKEGKYQIIRIGNVRPGVIRLDTSPVYVDDIEEKVKKRYNLKKGDVVISLTGTRTKRDYGFTAIIKQDNLLLNQRLAYIRFNQEYLPKFFLYFSWTEKFKEQFFGSETGNTGQGNVGMKSVKETLIPLTPLAEQDQIVLEIESRLSVCDKLEENIRESLEKAKALRQSILKKAFEGALLTEAELQQCRAAEDYMPAAQLLERIKKSK